MENATKGSESKAGKLYNILASKKAPEQIGKPVFEKDLEAARQIGCGSLAKLFGGKDDKEGGGDSLNFGSKQSTGMLEDDTRLRLFNLKKMLNNVELQAQIMSLKEGGNGAINAKIMEATPFYKNFLQPMLKSFNVTDFSNWIPTVNARFFFEEYEIPFILADQFDALPMESPNITVPGTAGHLEGVEEEDKTIFTEQFLSQNSYPVSARNNVVHTCLGEDLNQDSVPAIIDHIRRDLMMGVVRSEERALINGDDTGTPRGASHFDSDTQALALNQTFQKAYKGLRRRAYDNSSLGGGSQNVVYDHSNAVADKALFQEMLRRMKCFASEKDMLRWIMPCSIETDLVTGAIPELFTAFAFGGLASNVTGQAPTVFGIKPVTSQYVREDLNATAVHDGVTVDRTVMLLVHVGRFKRYIRQATRIWATPSLANSDQLLMAAKNRIGFGGVPQSATETSVVMGYNIKA